MFLRQRHVEQDVQADDPRLVRNGVLRVEAEVTCPSPRPGECPCPMFCVCVKCSQRTAGEHRAGDERFGRDWRGGKGCACPACRDLRVLLDEIDAGFARVTAAENRLADYRSTRDLPPGPTTETSAARTQKARMP